MATRKRLGRPPKFTPQTRAEILRRIRAGCFVHVAAGAAGIDASTLKRWLADERPAFRAFRAEVAQARAEARATKEAQVFTLNPLAWLRLGPGRDRGAEDPGWTNRPDHDAEPENPESVRVAALGPRELLREYEAALDRLEGKPEAGAEVRAILADPEATMRLLDAVQGHAVSETDGRVKR